MSASWFAYDHGRRDADFDARNGDTPNPRPRFLHSLLSVAYRDAYLRAYHHAYDLFVRRLERQTAQDLAQNSKLIAGEQVPRNKVFERGWRDGFDGKDTIPDGFTHAEVKVYERGHHLGKQYCESELRRQSRTKTRHQHCR